MASRLRRSMASGTSALYGVANQSLLYGAPIKYRRCIAINALQKPHKYPKKNKKRSCENRNSLPKKSSMIELKGYPRTTKIDFKQMRARLTKNPQGRIILGVFSCLGD